ncbi:MAG: ABC transporter ATP-binding protein [Alphaproteobacteria bacterium]|nr:ABC transporter ATP-binding protein [Alphaproteobacteria bacterium]
MNPLKITQITKKFSSKVLDEISFDVKNNEIFGFIGLNGQGKTTLIKIMLDLLDQDNGEVEIFGVSRVLPEARKNLCYLPEKFQPSLHQTGRDFLNFVLGFYGIKYNEIEAYEICKNLELNYEFLEQKISKFSKGMTQKLGLMAVFLSNADLIILDEPMSGLDPQARIALKKELLTYKNKGKTIFFSSHILSDMDEICDNIAVLHNTKIRYHGTPQGLKQKHSKSNLDQAFLDEIAQY